MRITEVPRLPPRPQRGRRMGDPGRLHTPNTNLASARTGLC
jgi:hypothetical protein